MSADLSASDGSKVTDDFAAWRLIFNPLKQEGKVGTTEFGSPDACVTVIDVVSRVRTSEVKISMQPCLVIAFSGVGHCLFNLTVLP